MDINQARNILGQINLAANEGAKGERTARDACSLIARLTDELAKSLDFPMASVAQAPVTESQKQPDA